MISLLRRYTEEANTQALLGVGAEAGAKAKEEELFATNEDVVELTTDNFNDNVHPINQYTVVNIFAPWCPVSKAFDPIYKSLANKTSERADVKFAILNGDNDIDMRHRLKIQSYPTMIVFKKGFNPKSKDLSKECSVYEGKRTMTDMQEWIANAAPTGATLAERKKREEKKKELNGNKV